jgi:predicted dehydrogenase
MRRWGIVGPGGVAERFARDLALIGEAKITAVASRSMARANAFADRHGIGSRYDDPLHLYEDDAVDVVYVATPHAFHMRDTLAALAAGKHVLCEKPMALSAYQAQTMAAAARERGLFLMEAMWTRFLPSYRELVEIVAADRIGEPVAVAAHLGLAIPYDPGGRLFDPALGGGAALDLGIYPIQLCSLLLGTPETVRATGTLAPTGVDDLSAAALGFTRGGVATVSASIRRRLSCQAHIAGTRGWIDIPSYLHCPRYLDVTVGNERERVETPHEGDGIRFQVQEVGACLDAGLIESATMPLDESVRIAKVLDAIRADLGVVYPGDSTAQLPP